VVKQVSGRKNHPRIEIDPAANPFQYSLFVLRLARFLMAALSISGKAVERSCKVNK